MQLLGERTWEELDVYVSFVKQQPEGIKPHFDIPGVTIILSSKTL